MSPKTPEQMQKWRELAGNPTEELRIRRCADIAKELLTQWAAADRSITPEAIAALASDALELAEAIDAAREEMASNG